MKKFWRNYIADNAAFWVFGLVSIVLLGVSFILPPTGVINATVLEGVAELFAFASLGAVYKAINKGVPASITHGGTTVSVNKDVEEDTEEKIEDYDA